MAGNPAGTASVTIFYPDFGTEYDLQLQFNPPVRWWVNLRVQSLSPAFLKALRQLKNERLYRILNTDTYSEEIPLDCFEEVVAPPGELFTAWAHRLNLYPQTVRLVVRLEARHGEDVLYTALEYGNRVDGYALDIRDCALAGVTEYIVRSLASVGGKSMHILNPYSTDVLAQLPPVRSISSRAPLELGATGTALHPQEHLIFYENHLSPYNRFPGITRWNMKVFQAWCRKERLEVPVWL